MAGSKDGGSLDVITTAVSSDTVACASRQDRSVSDNELGHENRHPHRVAMRGL